MSGMRRGAWPPRRVLIAPLLSPIGRPDILVHAEEVVRVVAAFDVGQTAVVWAIGLLDAVFFIVGHEVDVDTAGGEGCGCIEQPAGPSDTSLVLSRVAPTRVHVHDE